MRLSLRWVEEQRGLWTLAGTRGLALRTPVALGPARGRLGGALSQGRLAHCSRPSPAPFSSVKQEQLSPRGQAGPPESLGVPTAQETSVLRGEALAEGVEARVRPVSQQLPLRPRRVEAGMSAAPDPAGESGASGPGLGLRRPAARVSPSSRDDAGLGFRREHQQGRAQRPGARREPHHLPRLHHPRECGAQPGAGPDGGPQGGAGPRAGTKQRMDPLPPLCPLLCGTCLGDGVTSWDSSSSPGQPPCVRGAEHNTEHRA